MTAIKIAKYMQERIQGGGGGGGGGGGAPGARPPPLLKLEKIWFFGVKSWFFLHEIPQKYSSLPPLGAIFLSVPPLTWNPGSAPDMYFNAGIVL
jgi:hypothetical protein